MFCSLSHKNGTLDLYLVSFIRYGIRPKTNYRQEWRYIISNFSLWIHEMLAARICLVLQFFWSERILVLNVYQLAAILGYDLAKAALAGFRDPLIAQKHHLSIEFD